MGIFINNNVAALNAQRRLGESTQRLSESFARLSSGLRINRAADDAAGLAISSALDTDARVFAYGIRNVNDAISVLSIAEGALQELSKIAIRQNELAEQASNGVYSSAQRDALNSEAAALTNEYNRIIRTTSFNGRNLLDQSFTDVTIQAGYGVNGGIDIGIGELLGRLGGDGTFAAGVSYQTGAVSGDVFSADINGDGVDDIINRQALTVLIANGDGSFRAPSSPGGTYTGSPAAGDFDGDGKLDLVAVVPGAAPAAFVSLGNGNGTFKAYTTFAVNQAPLAASVGDMNGDGILDILVSHNGGLGYGFSVLLGNGNGTYSAYTSYAFGHGLIEAGLADLNGDNVLDVYAANHSGGVPRMVIMIGNGNGTFAAPVLYTVHGGGGAPSHMEMADVNGDGILDGLVTSLVGNLVDVFIGNANGTFNAAVSYSGAAPGGGDGASLKVEDFNSDGSLDIAFASTSTGTIRLMLGNGNGTFTATRSFAMGGAPAELTKGDYNNDGVTDLAAIDSTNGAIYVSLTNTMRVSEIEHIDLTTQDAAREALTTTRDTLDRVTAEIGNIGRYQSRFGAALGVLSTSRENFIAAASQIRDADVATEAAQLIRARILQQAGAAVLAQANQLPALALRLLDIE